MRVAKFLRNTCTVKADYVKELSKTIKHETTKDSRAEFGARDLYFTVRCARCGFPPLNLRTCCCASQAMMAVQTNMLTMVQHEQKFITTVQSEIADPLFAFVSEVRFAVALSALPCVLVLLTRLSSTRRRASSRASRERRSSSRKRCGSVST